MHKLWLLAAAAVTAAPAFAYAASGDAAPAARTAPPSRVTFTVTGTFSDGTSRVAEVVADVDGDGRMDEGELRFTCAGGHARAVAFAPREASSGMPTGKRMHKPMAVYRSEAVAAGASLKGNWDIKEAKGARAAASAPAAVTLDPGQGDLCT